PSEVDVAARGCIGRVRSRAEPEVVFEARWDWLGLLAYARLRVVGPAGREAHPGPLQRADPPVADQLAGTPEPPVRTLVAPGLEHDARLAHRVAHRTPFRHSQRQRFLAINVLLGLAGREHRDRVPVVRGADLDRIDVIPAQDLPEVDVGVATAVSP